MAKKQSLTSKLYQPKNLIIAALVGAGAFYYAFKQNKKKNAANEQRKTAEASSSISPSDFYKTKVGEIQAILGVAVDGVPGKQTNSAYAKRFGLDRGPIAPMTVQYYLEKAKADQIAFGL